MACLALRSRINDLIGPGPGRRTAAVIPWLLAACSSGFALEIGSGPPGTDDTSPARLRHIAGVDEAATEPILCGELIVWNSGRGVHAVRRADGRHPWKETPNATDSLIFPRGVSAAALQRPRDPGLQPLPACAAGARVVAVIDGLSATAGGRDAGALVCLDMSPTAEGRLAWIVPPPAVLADDDGPPQPTMFDGPPTADAALVICVVRSRVPSDWLYVAAFDARDGRTLWTRPLGTAIAADGSDHAARGRSAALAENLIRVNTPAGTVATFDRGGRPLESSTSSARLRQEKP